MLARITLSENGADPMTTVDDEALALVALFLLSEPQAEPTSATTTRNTAATPRRSIRMRLLLCTVREHCQAALQRAEARPPAQAERLLREGQDGKGRHRSADVREVDHQAAPSAGVPDGDADGKGDARAGDDGRGRHGHVLEDAMGDAEVAVPVAGG